jgi:phage tail sheath protein FI
MATLLSPSSPGVFVQEVPSQVQAITGVSTSTAAFVGVCGATATLVAKNPSFDPTATTGDASKRVKFYDHAIPTPAKTPVLITSWAQFTRAFGDLVADATKDTPDATATSVDSGFQQLAHAVFGFFNNGGSRCYVTRIDDKTQLDAALATFAAIDEIALVSAPGLTDDTAYTSLVSHCATAGDRFAILDGPQTQTDLTQLTKTKAESGVAPQKTDLAAWYFPWVKTFDPGSQLADPTSDGLIAVPPSGHIAGIYARVDTQRGVFKSPANEVVRGAQDVTQGLSRNDQDGLNPKGVNAIRSLNGNILVWGARTVGGDANADLKYISVRRTLLFLRESIEQGTQWAVFEPNTPALWAKISRNITAFLTTVWRSGALFGNTPQEAFFVKCDGDNNPDTQRNIGEVVADVGVAIARPAEFVVFRISQSTPTK